MKIAILGAGAMGSLFGGLLAETGEQVTLLDIIDFVKTISRSGTCVAWLGRSACRLRTWRSPVSVSSRKP